MIDGPFSLFAPFADRLRIALFMKEDDIRTDTDAAAKIGSHRCASLAQMHGNRTVAVNAASNRTLRADGMITSSPGLALCIRSADCQNFVVYDPLRRVAGLLHAGWRGLLAGAIPAFFRTLRTDFGVAPGDVYVGCGPSLCQDCAIFSNPVEELPAVDPLFFRDRHVDLRGIAKNSLLSTGVRSERISVHPDCTCCSPETYFSYRGGDRQAVAAGNSNRLCCVLLERTSK